MPACKLADMDMLEIPVEQQQQRPLLTAAVDSAVGTAEVDPARLAVE